jgi:mannose/fructose/N-acetylgalactosamine-specific phosphotransferase system component IIC
VSAKNWAVVVLAVIVLCLAVGFALAASLKFLLIGIAVVVAVSATYLAGRLDNRGGDG